MVCHGVSNLEDRWYRKPKPSRWRGSVMALVPIVSVLAITGVLLVAENGSQPSTSASIGPSSGPSAFDPANLVVGADTYSLALSEGSLIVFRTTGAATSELGRVEAPAGADASPPTVSWATANTMQCGSGSTLRLFAFGHLSSPGPSSVMTYVGPPADGGIADDGRFLFVLAPGVQAGARIEIDADGDPSVTMPASVGQAGDPGVTKQPSGCLVSG